LVFSSLPFGIVNVTVGREFSDHCLVYFTITSPLVTSEEPPRKIYMYGRGNYDQFRTDMANFRHRFFALSADREINDNWSQFKDAIHAAIDKNIPSKVVKSRKRRPQWLNPAVHCLIRKCDKLANVAKKSGLLTDRKRYHKARNTASKAIETEYHKCLNNVIGNVTSDPRLFYRFIKSKCTEPIGISTLKSGDNVLFNNNDKADCLNGYFASVFTAEDLNSLPSLSSTYPDMPDIIITVQNQAF